MRSSGVAGKGVVETCAGARKFGTSRPVRCWLGSLRERRNAGFVCLVLISYVPAVMQRCIGSPGKPETLKARAQGPL